MTVSRRRIWGWMAFDWASQPLFTLGLTFVFGPYFALVATGAFMAEGLDQTAASARAQSVWSLGQFVAGTLIAVTAPFLGAFADNSGRKIPWIAGFSVAYVLASWALWGLEPDGARLFTILVLFYVAFFAAESALNFVNAMLPSLGSAQAIGRISGSGAAFGYWGGVVSLIVMLALFVEDPAKGLTRLGNAPALGLDGSQLEGTRAVGPFIAVWYALFMVPFFVFVRDDPRLGGQSTRLSAVWGALKETLRGVLRRRSLKYFLLASMFYRDGLNALYAFGGIYGVLVLGWTTIQIAIFGIVAAVAAAILTWLGGLVDQRRGPMLVIKVCVWALIVVGILIVGMSRDHLFMFALPPGSPVPDIVFYACGIVIGGAGGALYAASRSLMVRHTDPDRPAEAFGLFALTGRATAFLAPLGIAVFTFLTGNVQLGFVPVILLFLLGLFLLRWVNPNGDTAA
ncbi:MFS transporter, UMF1 family [Loktanella fryxellensis]|uniref:MFS transporter, UMF1 family n=1 Tax=Loktanella fryxellensis TaxID=245187 RepID=A0A1H8J3E4_9RHOB|nr:MFS transporter [Loktanella fryxellensis]SEN74717.1 MFS transporter, UMF1 family [Loktanella fryxellensis]